MTKRNRHPGQRCPTCGGKAYVTTTRAIGATITERYYACKDPLCGHQFKTMTEITETVVPPLPQAHQRRQRELVLKTEKDT